VRVAEEGVDLPEPARPGNGSIGQVVRQRHLLQVGGDLADVVDAVVAADHRDHRERGNARSAWSGSVVKSAAKRHPSRHTQLPVLTSAVPSAGSRSGPRRGHGPVSAGGQPGVPVGLQNCHRS